MPVLLGISDMKQFAIPVGWDSSELAKFKFADGGGTTYEQVVNDIATALSIVNGGLVNHPFYGSLISVTSEMAIEYRDGGSGGMNERSEYTKPDARRGTTLGHMLPLKSFDRGLGWTYDFLRKARPIQIESDIAAAMLDVEDNWQKRILTRFFSSAENLIGTAGYDVGFVCASSTLVYTPPAFEGKSFLSTHTHFDRQTDDSAGRIAALDAGAMHLKEHGILGPYTAIVPEVDSADFQALTNFIKPNRGIQYVRTDSTAPNGQMAIDEMAYIGAVETKNGIVMLKTTPRLPTNYLGMFKPFGIGDQRNPLAVRYSPDLGVGALLLRGEGFRQYPLENAVIMHEFGVGCGNRLNGYACYFAANGSYTDPTIS